MPRQMLTGTLDEQCAFLYDVGRQKMEQGNYTGALHAFSEIVKYAPDYRDTAELLAEARQQKSQQRFLIVSAFGGAIAMVVAGSLLQLGNDLYLLGFALAGTMIGYGVGIAVNRRRQRRNAQPKSTSATAEVWPETD